MHCKNSYIADFYIYVSTLSYCTDIQIEIRKINFEESLTNPDLKKAIVVDCLTDKYIGRFTTWEDSSCVAEIVDVDTEKNILIERHDFDSLRQLQSYYQYFLSFY